MQNQELIGYIDSQPILLRILRQWGLLPRDVERWPEWTPTVTSVRRLKDSSFLIQQPKLPPAKWVRIELDEERRRFTWITRGPGMTLYACHAVEDLGGRSRAHLAIEFTGLLGPLFARLTAKLNDRYLALEANGLKRRSESVTS